MSRVDVLEANEHLIEDNLDMIVTEILRRSDELEKIRIHELENLDGETERAIRPRRG